jgi:hypothetical protein
MGHIAVDLDGTLAYYESGYATQGTIGRPIPSMLARVKRWLAEGREVKIFTARVSHGDESIRQEIEDWCQQHIGRVIPITCCKDYQTIEIWDDRAVQVGMNTGARVDGKE